METKLFGDAVKYFRRLSYKYGPDAYTLVLCMNHAQRQFAAHEARLMMEGGSLDYSFDQTKWQINTLRGSSMRFVLVSDNWEERVRGTYPTQVILPSSMPEAQQGDILERLKPYMGRSRAIDSGDERVDIATL